MMGSMDLMFDQYSRYRACADLLKAVGLTPKNSILDVGSGPECQLGNFLPEVNITYLDPLISSNFGVKAIRGDVFSKELDNVKYDYVVAIDVLEHIPQIDRCAFINRLNSLATESIVLAFPTSDGNVANEVDKFINVQYAEIYSKNYPWLHEHEQFGLPSLKSTRGVLENLGWHCQTIGHGYAPWLKELLGYLICLWDVPEMRSYSLSISQEFNEKLYEYDFEGPHYREFIVASRVPFDKEVTLGLSHQDSRADDLYQEILHKAKSGYMKASIDCFLNLSSQIKSLEADLIQKNIEAVKVSDWALQLLEQLNQLREPLPFRLTRRARSLISKARGLLSRTPIGGVYRRTRYYLKRLKKHISLKAILASVEQNEGRLIIAFPIITWEFRWQRPQHILSGLRDAGYSILYLAISLLPSGRKFSGATEAMAHLGFGELDQHINQIWLNSSGNVNVYTDSIGGDDLHNIVLGLGAVINSAQPKSIVYMIQFPGWSPVALNLKENFGGKIIFDCMDDHAGFSTNTSSALEAELNLIRSADLVITSSNLLEEKVSKLTNRVIQVKNATEFNHFNGVAKNNQLNQYAASPIIGYYGAISDWFDMELIAYCASVRPEWNFVLIGSILGADLHRVKALNNVHFLGEIPYAELPGYLAYFDVCTIPFKLIPLTLATNPVKFYEYLSAGKPVVSINLPELIPYETDCYLAKNPEEFLSQIESALTDKDDPILIARRLDLARKNSWEARVNCILQSPIFKS